MSDYKSRYTGAQIDDIIDWGTGNSSKGYTSSAKDLLNNIISGDQVIPKVKATQNNSAMIYLSGVVSSTSNEQVYNSNVYVQDSKIFSAAWNDFAEYRQADKKYEPGTVIRERLNGIMTEPLGRLIGGCAIVSDTFGMCIGKQTENSVPVAVAGRVLAKFADDINSYSAGDAVCGGPDGVSKMTREEIKEYPDRIIGYVSEIPTYDTWENVEVGNRIWIKVK